MRYLRFRVANYRAITGPLQVDVEREPLIPIIGINESGKTTILHAIFAFDSINDQELQDGEHLRDTQNLYRISLEEPRIAAEIEMTPAEYERSWKAVESKAAPEVVQDYLDAGKAAGGRLWVTRNLATGKYELPEALFPNPDLNDLLAQQFVYRLPYILFFDDFRDSIDETIAIPEKPEKPGEPSGWLAIFERLFEETDPTLSVFDLSGMDERQRESAVSEAVARLNETLTREWVRFGLDGDQQDASTLRLNIRFLPAGQPGAGPLGALKLEVVEKTERGADRYFYLLNRSKGFYWFCNFVLKLEFNPKRMHGDIGAIYLLDEPGSYLHNAAQARLCEKLSQLAKSNTVIYCTHSQYLLNPEVIPLGSIRIALKNESGSVALVRYHDYSANDGASRWAYQPLWDALRIRPFLTDLSHRKTIVVEGIADHYAFEMFKTDPEMGFVPGVTADSLRFLVTLLLGWNVNFAVLWDNDAEGRASFEAAKKRFGAEVAKRRFRLLPTAGPQRRKRILQDLFAGDDLVMIRQRTGLKANAGFTRTMESLYYHPDRASILRDVSAATQQNFADAIDKLPL
jgi:hypothetical protein